MHQAGGRQRRAVGVGTGSSAAFDEEPAFGRVVVYRERSVSAQIRADADSASGSPGPSRKAIADRSRKWATFRFEETMRRRSWDSQVGYL